MSEEDDRSLSAEVIPYGDLIHVDNSTEVLLPPILELPGPPKVERRRFNTYSLISAVSSLVESVRRLSKSVGFFGTFSMLVSTIIGSGVFISPSLVMHDISDVTLALALWLFSGLIALAGALCYCELGTTIKSAGGAYAYMLAIYGATPAFVCSWTLVLVVYPTGVAAIALTLGNYFMWPFAELIEPNPIYPKAVAAFCILSIALTNCLSVRAATRLQSIFTAFQMLSVSFLIVLGFWQIGVGHTENLNTLFRDVKFEWAEVNQLGSAFFGCIWAYNGWQLIGNITEEMINVEKHLFLAVMTAIPFVIVCYIAINIGFLTVLTPAEIGKSDAIAVDFVKRLFGGKVALVVPVLVVISCYGSANASIFACPRVTLAAGREGHMPALLGMIHKTRNTPIPAVFVIAFISLLILIPDASNLTVLVNFAGLASWILFLMTLIGIIVLRYRQPDLHRPFKVWLIAPILMSVVSVFLIVLPIIKRPMLSLFVICFMLLGLPVYFTAVYCIPKYPSCVKAVIHSSTRVIQTKLNLAPCVE